MKIKALLLILCVMVMSLFTSGCGCSNANAKSLDLTIVHTNDIHGRIKYSKDDKIVGYSKMKTYINNLKSKILLLDAGDVLHGQPVVTLDKGESAVSLMNLMGYNYFVPGNHDFNYGYDRLKELSSKMSFKILAANICLKDGSKPFVENDVIEIDGVKIGVFGLATPETLVKTNPENVKNLDFKDPVESAREQVKNLKGKGTNIIIAICHLGIDDESAGNRSYDVRDNVDGIDLIIDGHSHSSLDQISQVNGKAVITSTGAYAENLGVVNLTFKNGKTEIKPSNIPFSELEALETNKEIDDLIDKINKSQEKILREVIGKTEVELIGKKSAVRASETNLTKLISNIILKETGAQIVILNGGGFRDGIGVGEITYESILKVFPFGNYVVTKSVNGDDIIKSLEFGLSDYPSVSGKFPQIAGITVIIDKNAKTGSRINSVKINGKEIEKDKNYILATNDFISSGGDGYEFIGKSKEINQLSALDEILVKCIKDMKTISKSTIDDLPAGYVFKWKI